MARKIVDTILPTTMVGSYPRPHWFNYQLLGRDVRVAFKHVDHAEAYEDATQAVIHDQEEAGLDIVTDGQMCYDDYVGVIGSFCWYMYERIPGFEPAKEEHPAAVGQEQRTTGLDAPLRLGRRHQQRAGRARADPPRGPVQDRDSLRDEAGQGLASVRAPSTWPGTSTSSTTRIRASSASRWRRSSTPR